MLAYAHNAPSLSKDSNSPNPPFHTLVDKFPINIYLASGSFLVEPWAGGLCFPFLMLRHSTQHAQRSWASARATAAKNILVQA